MHPPARRPPRTVPAFLAVPRFPSLFQPRFVPRFLSPVLACLAFAGALLASSGAAAQFDAGTATTVFAPGDFFIGVQATPTNNLSDFEVGRFFNKAACDCTTPVYVFVALSMSGFANRTAVQIAAPNGTIEFWVGSNCNDQNFVRQRCIPLLSESLNSFLQRGNETKMTDARVLSIYPYAAATTFDDAGVPTTSTTADLPLTGNTTCTSPTHDRFTQHIYVLVSNSGTPGLYDTIATRDLSIVLTPPPPPDPKSVNVVGGDQALTVSWTKLDTAVYTHLFGYQILCNRGGDLQVFNDGSFSPGFSSVDGFIDAGVMCPGFSRAPGIQALDPLYVCSPLLTASASSYRVKILQNEIVYGVSVVSVDDATNPSQPPDIFYGTPIKTKSFYDVYRDGYTGSPTYAPGTATGGFCAVGAPGTRRGSALAVGLGGVAIAVARRRRRR
jgi:hypothetical protein